MTDQPSSINFSVSSFKYKGMPYPTLMAAITARINDRDEQQAIFDADGFIVSSADLKAELLRVQQFLFAIDDATQLETSIAAEFDWLLYDQGAHRLVGPGV